MSILRKIAKNKAVTALLLLFELLSLFVALSEDSLDWLIVAVLLLIIMVILTEVRIKVAIEAVENNLCLGDVMSCAPYFDRGQFYKQKKFIKK